MKRHIFVNSTAATSAGALTILKEFIENVSKKSNKEYIFYIFCTTDLKKYECDNIKIIDNIKGKAWRDRIIWDLYGLKQWSNKYNINPNLIISLQNTGVKGFKSIKQIIYLHQSIPYYKNIKWNIFKKDERIYWFYRHIYKTIIDKSVKKNDVVVQSHWMKKIIVKEHQLDENKVHVIKPNIEKLSNIRNDNYVNDNYIKLFYPATAHIYKNHRVLLGAIKILKKEVNGFKIKLYLTINSDEDGYAQEIKKYIKEYNLIEEVEMIGYLSYEMMKEFYIKSDVVVFPSYMETYGLPLIEAAQLGKSIVVSDLDYSKEVLEGYSGVYFANYSNIKEWSEKIKSAYRLKDIDKELKINSKKSWVKFINLINNLID